jgi:beta-phosphoglucomutase-like phosphatase (HAD superfamily)
MTAEQVARYSIEKHEPRHMDRRHTPKGEKKPNPRVLLDIVNEVGQRPEDAIYVGDSLMKDVAMAQQAGVTDVFARFGQVSDRLEYQQLLRVTHWTDEDVARERQMNARLAEQGLGNTPRTRSSAGLRSCWHYSSSDPAARWLADG